MTTPQPFDIYKPTNPIPFIVAPLLVAIILYAAYAARAVLIPILSSRIIWGVMCTFLCILFTSGYMWNKIKNAPYVQAGPGGKVSWVAGGYSNQLGLESQVVGALCESTVLLAAWRGDVQQWKSAADISPQSWFDDENKADTQTACSPSPSSSSPSSSRPRARQQSSASELTSGSRSLSSSSLSSSASSSSRTAGIPLASSERRLFAWTSRMVYAGCG